MAKEYNEVIEILNHIPKDDFKKIPEDLINMFKFNMDMEYEFKYDTKKTLNEQNVSKEAKTIIARLFRDYWATEKQKEKILTKEKYDKQIMEEEIREKYNPDDIFKKKAEENSAVNQSETNLIKYEENIFKKLINFIKRIFHK